MDCMNIEHEMTRALVSKLVSKAVTKKLDVDTDVDVEHLKVYRDELDRFHVELDFSADVNLVDILKRLV